MDEPPGLQRNWHWRMAVWSLRTGYAGLGIAAVGLLVWWAGSTRSVLAAGVIVWLATVVVTFTGFFWARHDLPEPRPRLWSMRIMLLRATVHPRPADPPAPAS